MELDIDQLPPAAAEIAELVGVEPTLRLIEAWGGVRLYVPQQMPEDHLLVSTLGRAEADALAERYGGETLNVPRCLHAMRAVRNGHIRRDRSAGVSPALLALRYGLTERQVYAIVAAVPQPQDERQQSLL